MGKATIYVVDDEQDILENYTVLLSDDYTVLPFNDPEAFIKYFEQPSPVIPDLVITDLKMPKIDGLQMIKSVQNHQIFFPFILLSGHLDKDSVMEAVEAGVFRLLEKPTSYDTLIETIDQLLVEHESYKVRKEIRAITSQLRELYTSIRMIMTQYIPEDIIERLVVDAPGGSVKAKMSFENLLENLESRLERLLESEKVIDEMRSNKARSQ